MSVRDCDAVTFTGSFGVKVRFLVLADRNSPLAGDSVVPKNTMIYGLEQGVKAQYLRAMARPRSCYRNSVRSGRERPVWLAYRPKPSQCGIR